MRYVVVTGTETRDELAETIRNLRDRQTKAVIPSTARELADDIDELVALLVAAPT